MRVAGRVIGGSASLVMGLMAAPATGQVIADLVAGRTPRIDIAPFHPGRFQHRMR